MSQIIIAAAINMLSVLLPLIGVKPDNDALTTTIQTIVTIVTGIWIWVRRVQMRDVNALGVRKY